MNDLEFLNTLTSQAPAAESTEVGYQNHPCGSFNGTIVDVKQKNVNERPVWEFSVKTAHGQVVHNRWGFSPDDLNVAKVNPTEREKMLASIKRHKRLFVDLKVWSNFHATDKTWVDILSSWILLKDQSCRVVVKPNFKRPGYTLSFINAPMPSQPDMMDQNQDVGTPERMAPASPFPSNPSSPGTPTNRRVPSDDFDNIPF